jgi:hypothetical protein
MMTTTNKALTFLYIFFLVILFFPQNLTAQKKDFAIWYTIGARYEITKKLKIDVSEEFRSIDNGSYGDQFFTDLGLSYKFNKYVSIGGYYRFIRKRENDETFHNRNRFYGDVQLSLPVKRFELSYRFRYQRQVNEYSEYVINDPILYNRHKISLEYNIPKTRLTPSIFYERFFRINESYNADNERYGLDLSYSFLKHHKIDLSYMINNDLAPRDKKLYILSIGYRFTF